MCFRVLLLSALAGSMVGQNRPSSCGNCPTWNLPQEPFKIYGSSYFVGTRGLSSILITSPSGHVLIDGALPESAPQIVANIRLLGFGVEDVKLIVCSHAHFDHAGGIAELQKLSGARVAASQWTASVLEKGAVPRDDPQFGTIIPIARVAHVKSIREGETLSVGTIRITAHLTPGHTPGGTSWTWRSCENDHCLNLVYADSLTPISAAGFRFSRRKEYSNGVGDFERSYSFLNATPCDILVTPHPNISSVQKLSEPQAVNAKTRAAGTACQALAATSREQLRKRLETERGQ
jgi:metallo-beta-lactamase class B